MDILASYGVGVPERIVVQDVPEDVPFDFPLVLKVSDPCVRAQDRRWRGLAEHKGQR